MVSGQKWRVFKLYGMWVVRKPGGGHFGQYFTWREAITQVTRRNVLPAAAASGSFDRGRSWDFDDTTPFRVFGFSPDVPAQAQAATATALGSRNR